MVSDKGRKKVAMLYYDGVDWNNAVSDVKPMNDEAWNVMEHLVCGEEMNEALQAAKHMGLGLEKFDNGQKDNNQASTSVAECVLRHAKKKDIMV